MSDNDHANAMAAAAASEAKTQAAQALITAQRSAKATEAAMREIAGIPEQVRSLETRVAELEAIGIMLVQHMLHGKSLRALDDGERAVLSEWLQDQRT